MNEEIEKEKPVEQPSEPICKDRQIRTKSVVRENRKAGNRLERDGIAPVFYLQVYAFNCTNHVEKDVAHIDFCGGATNHLMGIPTALQMTIAALESTLVELKKKVQ